MFKHLPWAKLPVCVCTLHSCLFHSIKKPSQRCGMIHYVLCAHIEVQVSFLFQVWREFIPALLVNTLSHWLHRNPRVQAGCPIWEDEVKINSLFFDNKLCLLNVVCWLITLFQHKTVHPDGDGHGMEFTTARKQIQNACIAVTLLHQNMQETGPGWERCLFSALLWRPCLHSSIVCEYLH